MELKDIKAIIDLMKKNSLTEFELEKEDFKIKLKRGNGGGMAAAPPEDGLALPAPALQAAPAHVPIVPPTPEVEIKSPMIGTLYRAPSPEAGNYVEVGSEVNAETIVCIIEAMKVMNEIESPCDGVLEKVLPADGEVIEYGEVLFLINPQA